MEILLDTHSFLWFIAGSSRLSGLARELIEETGNQPFLNVASLWEIAIKISLGKLTLKEPFETFIPDQLRINGIDILPIDFAHTAEVARLPFHHRDPFDRLIIAQGIKEELAIMSIDMAFDAYPIQRLW